MTVVTIGYEGRPLDEFIAELTDRGVEIVLDVRANAISRKQTFRLVAEQPALRVDPV